MLRVFNCFQFLALFVMMPHILGYLNSATFANAALAYGSCCILYVIMIILTFASLIHSTEKATW